MLSLIYAALTFGMLGVVVLSHVLSDPEDRDRLILGAWIALYWSLEELGNRTIGPDAVQSVAPAFDFATGVLLLVAWLFRPAGWKISVVMLFWAMCVAHLVYRLEITPSEEHYRRYRDLINALYVGTLMITSGAGVWDVIVRRPRHRRARGGGLRAGLHSGLGGAS